ncbi:ribosomal protein L7/L12 [Candidatus Riflebacteria bacterium]
MSEQLDSEKKKEIVTLLAEEKKIQAIKVYREATGLDLKEAKDYIDARQAELQQQPVKGTGHPTGLDSEKRNEIMSEIFAGRKVAAIKIYRDVTGQGLKEAKEFVDGLQAELQKKHPQKFSTPQGSGCGGAVSILFLCTVIICSLFFT